MRLEYGSYTDTNFCSLSGKTLTSVVVDRDNNTITFTTSDTNEYVLHHEQDCCESVTIESIVGDIEDLLNSPITLAEESSNQEKTNHDDDSQTWTFYKLATNKGYVDIRWFGTSNGYYSERVHFVKLK